METQTSPTVMAVCDQILRLPLAHSDPAACLIVLRAHYESVNIHVSEAVLRQALALQTPALVCGQPMPVNPSPVQLSRQDLLTDSSPERPMPCDRRHDPAGEFTPGEWMVLAALAGAVMVGPIWWAFIR